MSDATIIEAGTLATELVRQVQRNLRRFPADFMFQLNDEEWLRCQAGTSTKPRHGGRRYLPFAFSEQGVAMLSSVLRSDRAIDANIEIMRAFVRLRELLTSNRDLERKLDALERKYDASFKMVFSAIRKLMEANKPKPTLGFARKKVG